VWAKLSHFMFVALCILITRLNGLYWNSIWVNVWGGESQQPVSDLRLEVGPLKREAQYQQTPSILGKYISRRSRLSDSIYTDGMKHRLTARMDFWV
jgi:hypothetical protein